MKDPNLTESSWLHLLTFMPANLAETARACGAFVRSREVDSPETLLRLALAYAAEGSSLRTVAAWATVSGIAHLSDVALLKRLRKAAPWLGRLLTDLLAEKVVLPTPVSRPLRIRLVDATSVSRPGSKGTDWRIHLGFNLQTLTLDQVELTDVKGGETLKRLHVAPEELWVADRGYAHRAGFVACVRAGGQVVVRLCWQNMPLQHPNGTPFDLLAALRSLPDATAGEFLVQTAPASDPALPAVAGRLIAVRKSPEQAEASRRKARLAAKRKGKTVDPRTLEAAAYIILFTTVPAEWLEATAILDLYRFRWQIELAFKRMKSLLALDEMAAKDPELCKTFLLGKLLLFTLTERLRSGAAAFSPWGYGLPTARLPLAGDQARVRHPTADRGSRVDAGAMAGVPG